MSRICVALDEHVAVFRDRSLAVIDYPNVFLDATYCNARVNYRVVSQAVLAAVGVAALTSRPGELQRVRPGIFAERRRRRYRT